MLHNVLAACLRPCVCPLHLQTMHLHVRSSWKSGSAEGFAGLHVLDNVLAARLRPFVCPLHLQNMHLHVTTLSAGGVSSSDAQASVLPCCR